MSSVSFDVFRMPVSSSAAELARQRVLDEVRAAVAVIIERYGVTQAELAGALGVYAPPPGKGGSSVVSAWMAGRRQIDAYNRALLQMLADGELVLIQIGAESRRKIYKVVPADESIAA